MCDELGEAEEVGGIFEKKRRCNCILTCEYTLIFFIIEYIIVVKGDDKYAQY